MSDSPRASIGPAIVAAISLALFGVGADAADSPAPLASIRAEIASVDTELRAVEVSSDSLRARAEQVAIELATLERERSLGPVKRAQLSLYRQESERLAESRARLEIRRAELERRYRSLAEELVPLLDPAIDEARRAYQSEPGDSHARARLFRRFEGLVLERRGLRRQLSPSASFLVLDISMDPDDTLRDLRRKVDLLADNRDLLVRLLSRLSSWKRELIEDRAILSDWRKLQEENEFFGSTDPVSPRYLREPPPSIGAEDILPRQLTALADRLDVPGAVLATSEGYDRLIGSVVRVEGELEDEILAMDENQKMIEREIDRREDRE